MTIKSFSADLYNYNYHYNSDPKNKLISSLQDLITDAKDFFLSRLKNLDEREFSATSIKGVTAKDKKTYLVSQCEKIITESEKAIIQYQVNRDVNGFNLFYDIFFPHNKASDAANIKDVIPENFYRMRTADTYLRYNRRDIFIISEEKDSLVSRARFNDEGQPCLYLAANLFTAWEECRRPNFNLVNFSRFHREMPLKVMSINIIPRMKTLGDFIMGFFTILCSMKVVDDEEKYKFQYAVPNLFMKSLCTNIQHSGGIDGISYLSSRRFECNDFLFNSNMIDSNLYVFPPRKVGPDGICEKLAKKFKLTEPRTFFLYKVHRFPFDMSMAKISEYNDSLFAEIERQLKNEDLGYYND